MTTWSLLPQTAGPCVVPGEASLLSGFSRLPAAARPGAVACADQDADGICDPDACPDGPNDVDADGDGVANACDPAPAKPATDADGDGVCDGVDRCRAEAAGRRRGHPPQRV